MAKARSAPPPRQTGSSLLGGLQKKLPETLKDIARAFPQGTRFRVLFQDEGRFGRISDGRSCWAPLPLRPTIGSQIVREYIYAYVAVCPQDGQMSSLILPWVDAKLMSVFLAQTAAQAATVSSGMSATQIMAAAQAAAQTVSSASAGQSTVQTAMAAQAAAQAASHGFADFHEDLRHHAIERRCDESLVAHFLGEQHSRLKLLDGGFHGTDLFFANGILLLAGLGGGVRLLGDA